MNQQPTLPLENVIKPDGCLPSVDEEYLNAVYRDWRPARPTKVFATYWYFAAARQQVFFRRLRGEAPPWTLDPILAHHRFTNAYRASDRVSLYLIRNVQYPQDFEPTADDLFFRTILFKVFNRIETWQLLEHELGPPLWKRYRFDQYDAVLTKAMERGQRIFSAAYIMPSGNSAFGQTRKHRTFLLLIESMMADALPRRLARARSLREVFEEIRSYPTMGDFLAFQYAIDLNYSPLLDFRESSFVVAGPGAKDGIRKCFSETGGLSDEGIIDRMAERQEREFGRLGIDFKSLWGRPLQLIDCQNLFCEVDKYARVAHPEVAGISGRTRIKQSYSPGPTASPPIPWYPPKWGLNERLTSCGRSSQDIERLHNLGTE